MYILPGWLTTMTHDKWRNYLHASGAAIAFKPSTYKSHSLVSLSRIFFAEKIN